MNCSDAERGLIDGGSYPFVRAELQEHDPPLHELLMCVLGPPAVTASSGPMARGVISPTARSTAPRLGVHAPGFVALDLEEGPRRLQLHQLDLRRLIAQVLMAADACGGEVAVDVSCARQVLGIFHPFQFLGEAEHFVAEVLVHPIVRRITGLTRGTSRASPISSLAEASIWA